jgi:hypothetical protein
MDDTSRRRMKRGMHEEERRKKREARMVEALAQADTHFALEALGVLQETMAHFYFKAKVLKALGTDAPFEMIDDMMEKAAKWAKELAAFKNAKIMAMKLASDPNAVTLPEHMTLEELRLSIMSDIERLREMNVLQLPSTNGNGKHEGAEGIGRRAVGEASRGCLRLGGWPSARTAPRSLTLLGTVPGPSARRNSAGITGLQRSNLGQRHRLIRGVGVRYFPSRD